jgi:hypothetical protein
VAAANRPNQARAEHPRRPQPARRRSPVRTRARARTPARERVPRVSQSRPDLAIVQVAVVQTAPIGRSREGARSPGLARAKNPAKARAIKGRRASREI